MVGTVLMFRTIYLLILVYCYGGAITMEHPAGHKCTQAQWCIWLAGMIQRLLRAPDVETIQFLQGPLGQPFSKPTKLLIGRLPLLQRHLYAAYDVGWRSTVTLGGLDSDGWKTAAAKSYPSKLCEVLARSYLWYADRVPTSGQEDDPPQLAMAKEVLCNWDPLHRQHDVPSFETTIREPMVSSAFRLLPRFHLDGTSPSANVSPLDAIVAFVRCLHAGV